MLPVNIENAVLKEDGSVDGRLFVSETMSEKYDGNPFANLIRYCIRFPGLLTSIAIPTPVRCQATGLPTGLVLWGPRDSDPELLQTAAAVEAVVSQIDASKHV